MQITSKMEPINGNLTSSASTAEPMSHVSAEQVSGAFCHTFYVTLSESRSLITKFFGHESIFNFDGQIVTGAGEIAKLYNSLPESTHFKIHSIKGLPTLHKQGILITVIGSVNFRPFVQTFVLGQQGQKKYYVEIDNFQYLDNSFEFKNEQQQQAAAAPVQEKAPVANGHPQVNGKVSKKAPEPVVAEPVKQTPQKPQQTPKKVEEPKAKPEVPKEVVKSPKPQAPAPQPKQQAPAPIPEPVHVPAPAPVPQEQPKRTWATLVGGGKQQQPPQQQNYAPPPHLAPLHQMRAQATALYHQQVQQVQQAQQLQQQQPAHPAAQDAPHKPDSESINLTERKIYLGGITREIVPSNTAQAETEIKQVFYKFGEVEEVRMPRKVLDSPNDTSKHAFAFITMRSKQGVQAIFAGATRDENGVWKLPLKLDAFGFDGLAQISEQRDPPNGGGFRGGRGGGGGGFQQRGGQFFRRGGPGGPRGGGRGGFQNGQH